MPDNRIREYNPVITGFSGKDGPLDISLNKAKQIYGQLPSKYGFVSAKKNRMDNKTLNLETGCLIRDLLSDKQNNLKGEVYRFYEGWHRDMDEEFGINTAPFFNINPFVGVQQILWSNRACLLYYAGLDIKQMLEESRFIRKDILNSIAPDRLLTKSIEILTKKIKSGDPEKAASMNKVLTSLYCHAAVQEMIRYSDDGSALPGGDAVACFADEIAGQLLQFNRFHSLQGAQALSAVTGKGIEFEYASRDYSYLDLGKRTGDCTADKRNFQADRSIENIFWTVFSWILDKNYQILKVFVEGEFVMKVHLVPLYVTGNLGWPNGDLSASIKSDIMVLAIDAIETTMGFREEKPLKAGNPDTGTRQQVFAETLAFIETLAHAMNIKSVYAEKFSNTPWIRDVFNSYPEIFYHVDHLVKIDQLEDVFSLADGISIARGCRRPGEVFMELQMKNTYLSPEYIHKTPGVKSFALIRGNAGDGIPMKRIIGV